MPIHHVALRSPDPDALSAFYVRVLRLREVRRNNDGDGLYSIWLDLGGATLMVERGAKVGAPGTGWDGLFIEAAAGSGADWERHWGCHGLTADGQTSFTLYGRDPEGNRFGVSSYPEPLFPPVG